MICARAIAITVLLVSYGALGARQPAVRTSVPLPVPAEQLAKALGLDSADRSDLLISVIRLVFDAPDGQSPEDQKRRALLASELRGPAPRQADTVPLPLDASIWRETLLNRKVTDAEIAGAILSDRNTALLYHGLAALDDDTLGWLGPDRETLLHLRRNAAAFAAFGRSVRVRAGRMSVPGGPEADAMWMAVVGADASRPSAFVQRLFRGDGRLAWFYDTVMHLDGDRQRLMFGGHGTPAQRVERMRELLAVFESVSPEWEIPDRPFVRPVLDPSLVVSLIGTTRGGGLLGPTNRRIWESVFRDDGTDIAPVEPLPDLLSERPAPVDLAWLARRVSLVPAPLGRRRLETLLFAQRLFPESLPDEATLIGALRSASAFPALALTLERAGIVAAPVFAAAAQTASALSGIRSPEWRRVAVAEFQSAVAIIDRATRLGGIDRRSAHALISSLVALPMSADRGYDGAFAEWLERILVPALPRLDDVGDPIEEAVLSACAGVRLDVRQAQTVEWEGRRYRVDPAGAELKRLQHLRERQRAALRAPARAAATLGVRLAAATGPGSGEARLRAEQALAETLISIVYAVYLGEPDGAAVTAGDVAGRHDFGLPDGVDATRSPAWRFPREERGARGGWHVVGSLLGLDVALGRLALRRLDLSDMPRAPLMSTNERMTGMLTAALFNPASASDEARDEIAAAIARGRARAGELRGDRAELDRIAQAAGLSEWRREALGWTLEHERAKALSRFSLVELFWLGSPRAAAGRGFDAWGTATLLLDGCLCLRMPNAEPWESRAGRASTGHLATRGADVALRVAEVLAELRLSAALAPAVVSYAMQDVIDFAQPAFFDDWPAFERTVRDLPRERMIDYIAAVAADGALVPLPAISDARR